MSPNSIQREDPSYRKRCPDGLLLLASRGVFELQHPAILTGDHFFGAQPARWSIWEWRLNHKASADDCWLRQCVILVT